MGDSNCLLALSSESWKCGASLTLNACTMELDPSTSHLSLLSFQPQIDFLAFAAVQSVFESSLQSLHLVSAADHPQLVLLILLQVSSSFGLASWQPVPKLPSRLVKRSLKSAWISL